jgi:hypothetical protein
LFAEELSISMSKDDLGSLLSQHVSRISLSEQVRAALEAQCLASSNFSDISASLASMQAPKLVDFSDLARQASAALQCREQIPPSSVAFRAPFDLANAVLSDAKAAKSLQMATASHLAGIALTVRAMNNSSSIQCQNFRGLMESVCSGLETGSLPITASRMSDVFNQITASGLALKAATDDIQRTQQDLTSSYRLTENLRTRATAAMEAAARMSEDIQHISASNFKGIATLTATIHRFHEMDLSGGVALAFCQCVRSRRLEFESATRCPRWWSLNQACVQPINSSAGGRGPAERLD